MNGAHVAMKHLRISTGRGGQGANTFHLPWILAALVADGDSEASRKPLQTARAMNEILILPQAWQAEACVTGMLRGDVRHETERI